MSKVYAASGGGHSSSSIVIWVVIAAVVLIVVGFMIQLYNSLVRLKNNVKENWSNIDVLLKQRHDELPKLVSACKQYMAHERGTLESVTQARTEVEKARVTGDAKQLGQAETAMRKSIGNLFAVAENYPDLKADGSFAKLQQRVSELENQIADRRELYNDSVNLNNTRIEQFPAVIFAGMFGFKNFDLLTFSDAEKADVNLDDLFDK
jgi:LemA protein